MALCHYCKKECNKIHRDHKTPRKRGGSDSDENIVIACERCNLIKSTIDYISFKKLSELNAQYKIDISSLAHVFREGWSFAQIIKGCELIQKRRRIYCDELLFNELTPLIPLNSSEIIKKIEKTEKIATMAYSKIDAYFITEGCKNIDKK